MKAPRFFVPLLSAGGVELPSAEAHHAMNVLRLGAGDAVELFDGKGAVAHAVITHAKKGVVTVAVGECLQCPPRKGPRLFLAFAVPKGARLDWLLEKAAELGAERLEPIIFERSVAGEGELTPAKMQKWLGHCVSAAKQCGLDYLPDIRQPQELGDLLTDCADAANIVGDLTDTARPLRDALKGVASPPRAVRVLVGPEGDLTAGETAACRMAGFVPVRLGATVLRVETACIALLAGAIALLD